MPLIDKSNLCRATANEQVRSLLLATGSGSLGLSNTSDLLDSALDFLSLLSAGLGFHKVSVLYNTRG